MQLTVAIGNYSLELVLSKLIIKRIKMTIKPDNAFEKGKKHNN